MKPRNFYRIIIGALMTLSGLLAMLQTASEPVIGSILLVTGLAFLVTGVTGLIFMFGLFWVDYAGILRLETQVALALSIVVLALSARLYQIRLFRRGNVGD
jgi:hypothetical protein